MVRIFLFQAMHSANMFSQEGGLVRLIQLILAERRMMLCVVRVQLVLTRDDYFGMSRYLIVIATCVFGIA